MTEEQELIYGLRRWLIKGTNYISNLSYEEFIDDEKSFDATCFTSLMVSEIASRLLKNNEQFPLKNLKNPAELKQNVFISNNIDMEFMYNFYKDEAPKIILELSGVIYLWKTKK